MLCIVDNTTICMALTASDLLKYKEGGSPHGFDGIHLRLWAGTKDDIHGAIIETLKSAQHSICVNMFGFDDEEFSKVIQDKLASGVFVQMSLDKSQYGGAQEQKVMAEWDSHERQSVAIGNSIHGAISHLKLLIVDGAIMVSGSTNWSLGGEQKQDNECLFSFDANLCAEARTRLDIIHQTMRAQMAKAETATKT